MANQSQPSVEFAKQYIYSIDFSNIINKMVEHQGWRRKEADKLCELYRNFLFLNKKYEGGPSLPPSEEIDEFWHQHILDTKKYHNDCQAIFGHYFHHYPYFGIDENSSYNDLENAFKRFQELHLKEFNYEIYTVRSIFSGPISVIKKLFLKKPKKM